MRATEHRPWPCSEFKLCDPGPGPVASASLGLKLCRMDAVVLTPGCGPKAESTEWTWSRHQPSSFLPSYSLLIVKKANSARSIHNRVWIS